MARKSSVTYIASHHTGRSVEFASYDDAVRFVLKRGDQNELWGIREKRS